MTAPTEFRYREREHGRVARAIRTATKLLAGFDPAPDDAVVRAYEAAYAHGDPLAEAFVAEHMKRGPHGARAALDAALAGETSGTSAALAALLADIEAPPSWLDRERAALGAKAFRRYGSAVFRFAGAITLAGYRESSVAKPLALSGAYVGAGTRDRFLETASFWIDVSEPGGLERGAPGLSAALRVRLLHATVRLRLKHHREWSEEKWGVPINEADALLTLMGGSVAPGLAMQVLGFRPSRAEIEAMLHFWRWVGHLMGVRFSPYPETVEDGLRISYLALLRGSGTAGEDGRALCKSYVEAFARTDGRLLSRLEEGLHRGMTRLFVPTPVYREQALPPAGLWPLLPLLPFPLVFTAETLRRHVPGLDAIADRVARAERRRWLDRQLAGKTVTFQARRALAR